MANSDENTIDAVAVRELGLQSTEGEKVKLGDLIQAKPLLLQFSRHLGCTFCIDHAKQLVKNYETLQSHGLEVALVVMGTAEEAKQFRESLQLGFRVLVDPDQSVYQAFQVHRGSLWQVAGPQLWMSGLKSVVRSGLGRPRGDLMQLSGTFLIDTSGEVVWSFRATDSSQFPNIDDIIFAADSLTTHTD